MGAWLVAVDKRSPSHSVTRVRFPYSPSHVGEFVVGSHVAPCVSLRVLQFSSLHTKTDISQFQFDVDARTSIDNSPRDQSGHPAEISITIRNSNPQTLKADMPNLNTQLLLSCVLCG